MGQAESLMDNCFGGTGKYYQGNDVCVRDCLPSAGHDTAVSCGGIVGDSYVTLYEELEGCCSNKVGWKSLSECMSDSMGSVNTAQGSRKYYVDWSRYPARCVLDCGDGERCGGLASPWEELFDSSYDCCQIISTWVDRKDCIGGQT